MRKSNFSKIVAVACCWRFRPARRRPAISTMSAPCSTRTTAGSTIGMRRPSAAEQKYGVPVPVLMATVRKESGFKTTPSRHAPSCSASFPGPASPAPTAIRRRWTAHGRNTRRETGNFAARRTNFADAVDFVGWYHAKTADTYGVARNDTFSLYLAYYARLDRPMAAATGGQCRLAALCPRHRKMARDYAEQLRQCGNR